MTVGDVVLAASGKGISAIESALKPRQRRRGWPTRARPRARRSAQGDTITEVFLAQAARSPGAVDPGRPGQRRGDLPPARARPAADGARDPGAARPLRRHHAARLGRRGPVLPGRAVRRQDAGDGELDDRRRATSCTRSTCSASSASSRRRRCSRSSRRWASTCRRCRAGSCWPRTCAPGSRWPRKLAALVRSHLDWGPLRRATPRPRGGRAVHERVREPAEGGAADARQPPDQHPRRARRRATSTTATC